MKKGIYRLAAFFALGMLFGGVVTTMSIGGQVDKLEHTNELLCRQLELCQDELNHLKKSMGEREKEVVTGIETHIEIAGEDMTRLEENAALLALDKQVRAWLEPVKGQEVKKLNHLLVPQIIDNRTVDAGGTCYLLKVKLVVIGTKMAVYLTAKREKLPGQRI